MVFSKHELKIALELERQQLITLVASLSGEQLDNPSLCAGWSNRNVLAHIIGYEVSTLDGLRLLLKLRSLEEINTDQANRYLNSSAQDYIKLLERGHKRVLRLLRLTPSGILNKKLIPVPKGKLSPGQLFGDLVFDRAVHRLDIAFPLRSAKAIDSPEVMGVAVKFVFRSIDLLNAKLPSQYHGQTIAFKLSGLAGGDYSWRVGTDQVSLAATDTVPVLTVTGDTNDFLFTLTGRTSLIQTPLVIAGDEQLAATLEKTLSSNALWEL